MYNLILKCNFSFYKIEARRIEFLNINNNYIFGSWGDGTLMDKKQAAYWIDLDLNNSDINDELKR